ncbi:AAA family ATPase [uncultured Dokdonia sp.]|uniref:AAA family ATPase n=1 Tax=uncultured Dokdonia sp. TaxID=575653 RepID=UPI0030EF5989|tara:strand:+ start:19590 stop:21143 length:1554 start_codon:yes stop_codon:yes gene_type:complete
MKERINRILHALNENLFEREEIVKLTLLTTIAGESIFLLGQPGVAKSLIARRIKEVFKDGNSFEYLMNRFSTPDEIFGPIAISKLKKEDKYERITEKYLPTADIVFLDEIWKAGPSIQNSLLTVINEKVYRNGQQEIQIPLKGLISASNELPAKGEGLEALWDRFIIRYLVENISDPNKFNIFLSTEKIGFDATIDEIDKITTTEFDKWKTSIGKVKISDEALNVINVIRNYIIKYNEKEDTKKAIYVSDRRWKKIVKVLKTSAFLNDRKTIDLMDCFLIAHTIWDEVEQIDIVKGFVIDAIKFHGYSLKYNLSMFANEIEDLNLDIENQIKTKREIIYYEPKVKNIDNKEYFEVIDFSPYFYISKSDFVKLSASQYQTFQLWSRDLYDRKRYEVKRINPTTIRIRSHDRWDGNYSKGIDYELTKNRKSKTEIVTQKPHNAIITAWDKKVSIISKEIDKIIKTIEAFKNKDLASLRNNIFINQKLAALAEYNLNQTIDSFALEKIKVEKLKKVYEAL